LVSFLSPIDYSLENVNYISNVVEGNLPGTYTITESSRLPDFNYEPYNAFDNNNSTLWVSNGFYNNSISTRPQINGIQGEYIILECPIRYKLNGYRLKNSSLDTNIPDTVYLFGSNDKSTWTQLDFQQNLVSTVQEMNPHTGRSWFTVTPQESYKSYAILVSKLNTNLVRNASINKIEFLGTPDTSSYVIKMPTRPDIAKKEDEDMLLQSSSSTYPSPTSSSKLSGGAIAGIVIGVLVFLIIFMLYLKK
jgi:hypothetical protein